MCECMELGLSHLSRGIHERFATLAVWAQGAEYHRLALMLRRIAHHVEQLLERAGGADEHRLLDEITIAYGLVASLNYTASQGNSPSHLVGAARSRYEQAGSFELLGLGAAGPRRRWIWALPPSGTWSRSRRRQRRRCSGQTMSDCSMSG
jgi:hypothetical protein